MPSKPKTPAVPPDSWYGAVRAWLPAAPDMFTIKDVMYSALRDVRATENSPRVDMLVCARVLRGLGCVKVHTARGKRWVRPEWAAFRQSQRCYMPTGIEGKKHRQRVGRSKYTPESPPDPMWLIWLEPIRDWLKSAPEVFTGEDVFRLALGARAENEYTRSCAAAISKCMRHLGMSTKHTGTRRVYTTKTGQKTSDLSGTVKRKTGDLSGTVSRPNHEIRNAGAHNSTRQRKRNCSVMVLTVC